ncbi:dual specificity protein phosphatase 19-like [Mizuhopecten yessoensis]|uniref:Dual specificity protein phosphatase 19 n=1 Tax=Mizuhopecten yessoensis TaxID=6573 RepID=A0A210QL15_MIZYE|nr:dual specificity protein phosphatase 19-like [Mizuhopecten yessoensis]XP_021355693.1 dual specificity protein phosphatase 19-like [Mizuhopecten yessoensis]OWF49443.1 Dual specificity protein phosphatase 19 [Mizuhopecten yessoensis]
MASGGKKSFRNSLKESLTGFKKCSLKKTETKVTTAGGESFIESHDEDGKTVSKKTVGQTYGFVGWGIPDMQVGEILPGLLLSSQDVACDQETLLNYNVTHILNVASFVDEHFPRNFTYKSMKMDDHPDFQISQKFEEAFSFIDQGRVKDTGVVLVHCNAGVSRAATVVIGYLMSREGMTLQHAYGHVKDKRPAIRPNDGFQSQLKVYGEQLKRQR